MTKRRTLLLSFLLVSLVAGERRRAQAAEVVSATAAAERRAPTTAVGVDLGLGSAVGLAGLTLTQAFGPWVRLELGGGYGVSGYQLSVMPKLALGDRHDRFVAGVGVAVALPTDPRLAAGHPLWLNIDAAGYEHRFDSGFAVSATFGVTGGLGGGQICLPPDGCEQQFLRPVSAYWMPQGRVGAAYWF
ncbi:MAG TPA: hypothetical protein VKZ18_26715 [Polyangia bacterium]|nr:hypothetical protein [Polyangia bacterium]